MVQPRPVALAVATAVSAGLLAFGAYSVADHGTSTAPAAPSTQTATGSPSPTASAEPTTPTAGASATVTTKAASPSARPTPRTSAPATVATQSSAVPIYYAATQPGGSSRLFREFHKVAYTKSRGAAAVLEMLHVAPADRDYRSLWPVGTVLRRYALAGDTVTADFSAAPTDRLAVQQLVYTVTAVEAAYHVSKVRLLVAGASRGVFTRTSHAFVEGSVWVTGPYDGAQVTSPVTVEGVATVFRPSVSWELRRGGTLVRSGVVRTASKAPARGAWKVVLTLTPGRYEFRAMSLSGSNHVDALDSKSFVVAG